MLHFCRCPSSPSAAVPCWLRLALSGALLLAATGDAAALSEVPESFARVSVKSTTGSTSTLTEIKTVADADPPSSSVVNNASDAVSSVDGLAQASAPPVGSLTGTLKSRSYSSGTEFAEFTSTFTEAIAQYHAGYQVAGPGGTGTPVPLNLDITLDGFLDVDSAPSGMQLDNPRTATAEVFLNVEVWASHADFICGGLEGCDAGEFVFSGSTRIRRSSRTSGNQGLVQAGDFVGTGLLVSGTGNDRWDVALSESILVGFTPLVGDTIVVKATLTTRATYLNYVAGAGDPALESTSDFSNTFSFLPTSSDPEVSFAFVVVPEPGVAALVWLGLLPVLAARRRD